MSGSVYGLIFSVLRISWLGLLGCGIAGFVMALLGKRSQNAKHCQIAKKLSTCAFVLFGVYLLMMILGLLGNRMLFTLATLLRIVVIGALLVCNARFAASAVKACAGAAETTAQVIPAAPAPAPAPAAAEQAAPVVAEVKAAPAVPAAPAAVPVTAAAGSIVLDGKKNKCIINDEGIRYQSNDEAFFAPYVEIENFYKFGMLYSFLYKGKEYSMEQTNTAGAKIQDAFAYATECWEKARANMPAVRALRTDGEPVYIAETFSMILNVYNDWCTMTAKKNAANLLIMGKFFNGDKKYYYSDLTAVQFREPGKITDGYLEFEYPGSRSGKNDNSYASENSITFGKAHTPLMREIYTFIDKRIHDSKHSVSAAPQPQTVSAADELKKYKELLDMGVITQEEFDAKKKQVLGL